MMSLITDECYWCEVVISRPATSYPVNPFKWADNEQSIICLFHPANFDARTLTATGETAHHQTMEEVHDIIIAEFHRNKAQLAKQPLRAVKDNVVSVARRAQRTSRQAAEKLQPSAGTIRAAVWQAIKDNHGMTDYELETLLRGKHQTISASRRSLVLDGWIIDSGTTRKNPQGNDCIVWVINTRLQQGLLL